VTVLFYIAAAVAVVSTLLVVTRNNLVHALLNLVVSLFAVAVIFFTLGAPFVAALEVIVYAGAIMMLFVFAVMLLNVRADEQMKVPRRAWIGPVVLVAVLLAEVVYGVRLSDHALAGVEVGPGAVSDSLFGPYVLGVELASMLLLAALVGARHVASQPDTPPADLAAEYVPAAGGGASHDEPSADGRMGDPSAADETSSTPGDDAALAGPAPATPADPATETV
jgi:NADH-quinone oxidoreductase subunit J